MLQRVPLYVLPLLLLSSWLVSAHDSVPEGLITDPTQFNTCNASMCYEWCANIPCCVWGYSNDGQCALYSRGYRGPRPPVPECPDPSTNQSSVTRCWFNKGPPIFHNTTRPSERKPFIAPEPMTLCFHTNHMNERGTERATYDYAYFAKHMMKYDVKIITPTEKFEHPEYEPAKGKYFKEFGEIHHYKNTQNWINRWGHHGGPALAALINSLRCHMLYSLKGGYFDDHPGMQESWMKIPWAIHNVFVTQQLHGTSYAGIGPHVTDYMCPNGPVVYHMVYRIPRPNGTESTGEKLRSSLGVQPDDILLCRHGATNTFSVGFVKSSIASILQEMPNVHLLLMNTDRCTEPHARIHHIEGRIDEVGLLEYFEACDAMLHARDGGETFGCAVAEMSAHNRPVLTCDNCGSQQHTAILGKKAFRYNDVNSLRAAIKKLVDMGRTTIHKRSWNAYKEYGPRPIMKKFHKVFIEPAMVFWDLVKERGIKDVWNTPSEQLPPRYFWFWRSGDDQGVLRPTFSMMKRFVPQLCSISEKTLPY